MLKILRYMHTCEYKKSSMCQNDQNFININYIKVCIHVYKCKKSSICQNDQNFMNIKYIKAYACI